MLWRLQALGPGRQPAEAGCLTPLCALQGADTDKSAVDEIRKAVKAKEETTVRLLNYTKEGKPFWNMLSIAPINDAEGVLRFYIGVQARCSSQRSCLPNARRQPADGGAC